MSIRVGALFVSTGQVATKADISYALLNTDLAYVNLSTDIRLDYDTKNRVFTESIVTSEALAFDMSFVKTDSVEPVDSLSLAYSTTFDSDAVSLVETIVVSQGFGVSVDDVVVINDLVPVPLGFDGLINSVPVNEVELNYQDPEQTGFQIHTGPGLSDSLTLSEDIVFVMGQFRGFDDKVTTAEIVAVALAKAISDTVTLADEIAINFHDYNELIMDVTPSDDVAILFIPAAALNGSELNEYAING